MNSKEIIDMAREAGFYQAGHLSYQVITNQLNEFAALIASAEREKCAKVCDDHPGYMTAIIGLKIRARGQE